MLQDFWSVTDHFTTLRSKGLMITSYSARGFWLTVLKMNIKIGLFFFLSFCCIMTPISDIIDHYYIMEKF